MVRLLFVLSATVLLTACESKMAVDKKESICVSIIKSTSVDPSSMVINSVENKEYNLSESDFIRFQNEKFDGNVPSSNVALRKMLIEEGASLKQSYVQVDYTSTGGVGKFRDRALCWFVNPKSGYELSGVTVRGVDYKSPQLLTIFLKYGKPAELDVMNRIK